MDTITKHEQIVYIFPKHPSQNIYTQQTDRQVFAITVLLSASMSS